MAKQANEQKSQTKIRCMEDALEFYSVRLVCFAACTRQHDSAGR